MQTNTSCGATDVRRTGALLWLAEQNAVVGWCSLAGGALTGLVLGLWSFGGPVSTPEWIGDYDELSRRFLRLGHIACFGLGMLNIMVANRLPALVLPPSWRRAASLSMNAGNLLLPPSLFAAGGVHALKYLAVPPAIAVTVALAMTAYGVVATEWQRRE